jgi:hypothetical protein
MKKSIKMKLSNSLIIANFIIPHPIVLTQTIARQEFDNKLILFHQIDSSSFVRLVYEKNNSIDNLVLRSNYEGKLRYVMGNGNLFLLELRNEITNSYKFAGCGVTKRPLVPNLRPPQKRFLIMRVGWGYILEIHYDDIFPLKLNEWLGFRTDKYGVKRWFYLTFNNSNQSTQDNGLKLECNEKKIKVYPFNGKNSYEIISIQNNTHNSYFFVLLEKVENKIQIFQILLKDGVGTNKMIYSFTVPDIPPNKVRFQFNKFDHGHFVFSYPNANANGTLISYLKVNDSLQVLQYKLIEINEEMNLYPQIIKDKDTNICILTYSREKILPESEVLHYLKVTIPLNQKDRIIEERGRREISSKFEEIIYNWDGDSIWITNLSIHERGPKPILHGSIKK